MFAAPSVNSVVLRCQDARAKSLAALPVHFLDDEDLIYVAIDVRLPVAHDVARVVGLAAVFRRRLIGGLGIGAQSAIRR